MPIVDSLVAFWDMDEASGPRADAHGSHTLADNNTVTSTTGKVGTSALFVKANTEYLNEDDTAGLSASNRDFMICGWVYFETVGAEAYLLSKGTSVSAAGLEYRLYSNAAGGINSSVSNGSAIRTATVTLPVTTATWYFIEGWYDTADSKPHVRINRGTAATSVSALTGGPQDTAGHFRFGASSALSAYLDGRLDSWGFWDRILSSDELDELYNAGAGVAYADIAGGGAAEQDITPTLLSSPPTLHSPAVTVGSVTVAPDLLSSAATVHSPSLAVGSVAVAPAHLASTAVLHQPAITAGPVTVAPALLNASPVLHSPAVTPGAVTISPDVLSSATTIHAPAVSSGGAPSQQVQATALAGAATLHSPTVTVGPVTVLPATLASPATLHQPMLATGAVTITLDHIASTSTLHQPALSSIVTVQPSLLSSTAVPYSPALTVGPVTILPAPLSSTLLMHAPVVGGAVLPGRTLTAPARDLAVTAPTRSLSLTARTP